MHLYGFYTASLCCANRCKTTVFNWIVNADSVTDAIDKISLYIFRGDTFHSLFDSCHVGCSRECDFTRNTINVDANIIPSGFLNIQYDPTTVTRLKKAIKKILLSRLYRPLDMIISLGPHRILSLNVIRNIVSKHIQYVYDPTEAHKRIASFHGEECKQQENDDSCVDISNYRYPMIELNRGRVLCVLNL